MDVHYHYAENLEVVLVVHKTYYWEFTSRRHMKVAYFDLLLKLQIFPFTKFLVVSQSILSIICNLHVCKTYFEGRLNETKLLFLFSGRTGKSSH